MSAKPLTGAQLFVLRDMQDCTSRAWLSGHYAKTRYALQRKGLIVFNDKRGAYELTPAGRTAAPLEKCGACGGTGEYAPGDIGRDFCDECRSSGVVVRGTSTAMAAAISRAGCNQ
jgi:hypothetical protein